MVTAAASPLSKALVACFSPIHDLSPSSSSSLTCTDLPSLLIHASRSVSNAQAVDSAVLLSLLEQSSKQWPSPFPKPLLKLLFNLFTETITATILLENDVLVSKAGALLQPLLHVLGDLPLLKKDVKDVGMGVAIMNLEKRLVKHVNGANVSQSYPQCGGENPKLILKELQRTTSSWATTWSVSPSLPDSALDSSDALFEAYRESLAPHLELLGQEESKKLLAAATSAAEDDKDVYISNMKGVNAKEAHVSLIDREKQRFRVEQAARKRQQIDLETARKRARGSMGSVPSTSNSGGSGSSLPTSVREAMTGTEGAVKKKKKLSWAKGDKLISVREFTVDEII